MVENMYIQDTPVIIHSTGDGKEYKGIVVGASCSGNIVNYYIIQLKEPTPNYNYSCMMILPQYVKLDAERISQFCLNDARLQQTEITEQSVQAS